MYNCLAFQNNFQLFGVKWNCYTGYCLPLGLKICIYFQPIFHSMQDVRNETLFFLIRLMFLYLRVLIHANIISKIPVNWKKIANIHLSTSELTMLLWFLSWTWAVMVLKCIVVEIGCALDSLKTLRRLYRSFSFVPLWYAVLIAIIAFNFVSETLLQGKLNFVQVHGTHPLERDCYGTG